MIRNTNTYNASLDDELAFFAPQFNPNRVEVFWLRIGAYASTTVALAAIWFLKIAPDDRSPHTLMVQPAEETLATFIQPATDMSSLSAQVGFQVQVPDLKCLGIQMTMVGESEFGGQHAAVMQYQHGNAVYLLYAFSDGKHLIPEMRLVRSGGRQYFVTSEDAVSVVAWRDGQHGYHALAARSTEQELLALAVAVDKAS